MVGVNSNYNYYQPQVPSTFGGNNSYGNTNFNPNSNPYKGDTFSVDNTSKAFDEAMAKLTGKPVFNANTTNTNQTAPLPPGITQQELNWALDLENKVKSGYKPNAQETAAYQALASKMSSSQTNNMTTSNTTTTQTVSPPSQEEINWALDLENKVKGGYTPNAQETAKYQDIAKKLQAAQSTGATTQTTVSPPSQEEINWALDLENKVKGGYTPNAQETAKYQDIANRLQNAQSTGATTQTTVSPPSQEEINWALDLENKVKGGYTPNAQETAKYQDIAKKLQAAQNSNTSTVSAPSQDEVNWALDLENKVKGGYTPNAQETAKYQDIANRLQNAQTSNNGNRDWASWSQPFSVPRSIFQTTPRIIQVPSTLRQMNNNIPANTSVNAGPNLNNNTNVSNDEIQWALALENKVKGGYTPNESELYQYKQIADKLQAMKNSGNLPAQNNNTQNNNVQNNTQPKSTSIGDRMKNAWNALMGK